MTPTGARSRSRSLALLLGLAGVAACGPNGTGPVAEDVPDLPADQVIERLTLHITVDGVREALLLADSAYEYRDSTDLELRRVDLRVFGESGQERAHLTSRSGVLDTRTQGMTAIGDVRVTTRENARVITTEELHYDPEGDRIWSDVPTTIVENGVTTHGREGFEADGQLRNIRIRDASARGLRVEF